MKIKLTQYSHGAGCGCKISPEALDRILSQAGENMRDPKLLIGNYKRDDAAVYDIGDGRALISTTDFFMPIVDDPLDFGNIAAANALSDIYAMGGKPLMALSLLGWPIDKLPIEVASEVIRGAGDVCKRAGIQIGGGHSIDTPEPIFGLAVTGIANTGHICTNSGAREGDLIFLSKPLGIGILGTAIKKGLIRDEDYNLMLHWARTLNSAGETLSGCRAVDAMTDVTGFGLLGHLSEMCRGSGLSAILNFSNIPRMPGIERYITENCLPGGINRNWKSYGALISGVDEAKRTILCDPQTNGGLLVAVDPGLSDEFHQKAAKLNLDILKTPIGQFTARGDALIRVIE